MPGFPLKPITALAAVASFLSQKFTLDGYPHSGPFASFVVFWLTEFLFWVIWEVILYPKFFSPLRHLPTPKVVSWWNGHYPMITELPTGKPMLKWINEVPNNGLIRYLGLLNAERVFITSPSAIREVHTTRCYDFIKPEQVVSGLSRLLGVGILFMEGNEHKKLRRDLMPAFAFRHVKDLYPGFWQKSVETVKAMILKIQAGGIKYEDLPDFQKEATKSNEKGAGSIIEMTDWASRATLDIIGVAGMGHDFGAIHDPNTLLNRTYRTVFKPSRQAQILGVLGVFLPHWLVSRIPMKRNGEIEAASAVIRDTCRQMIRKKKEKLEKGEKSDIDILSVALASGSFTEESLVDQMMTFLAAGHDTTASALTWAVYLLSVNPSYQERLRAEVRENLPRLDSSEPVTSAKIDSLTYLNAVCSEVLRFTPPVSLTLRDAAVDTSILGQRIPKGTRIIICPEAVNKSEKLWGPDATKFNPDRWLPLESNKYPSNGGAASNYSLLTFIHGPRSCIGMSFAKAEFACLVATLVGSFEFSLNDERERDLNNVEIKAGVTAKPTNGLYVRAKFLEGW